MYNQTMEPPEQNGVADRTLVESARSMLLDVNLPHKFWAEAVSTAAPTKAVKGTKPKCLDAMFLPIFRKRFSMEFLLHLSQLRKHIVECGVLSSNSEDSEEEKSRYMYSMMYVKL